MQCIKNEILTHDLVFFLLTKLTMSSFTTNTSLYYPRQSFKVSVYMWFYRLHIANYKLPKLLHMCSGHAPLSCSVDFWKWVAARIQRWEDRQGKWCYHSSIYVKPQGTISFCSPSI